jgi:hypothetical protein
VVNWLRTDDLSKSRLETKAIVDHVARYRIQHLAILLAMWAGIRIWVGLRASDIPGLPVMLALLVVILLPRAWPRLERVQQIVQDAMVWMLTLGMGMGGVLSLIDVFDRESDARLKEVSGWLVGDGVGRVVAIVLILLAVLSLLLAVLPRPRPNRIQLTFVLLMASFSAATVSLPAAWTRMQHNPGGLLDEIGPAWAASLLCVLGWTVGVLSLLVLARRQRLTVGTQTASADSAADQYVSAGSAVAVTSLLITFFGVTTCWSYAENLDRLIGVRTAVATDMIAAVILGNAQLSQELRTRTRLQDWTKEGEADFDAVEKAWPKDAGSLVKPAWMEEATITPSGFRDAGLFSGGPDGSQFDVSVKEVGIPGSWEASPALNFPNDLNTSHTLGAAASCVDTYDPTATFDKVYWTCEKSVLGKGVKFPFVDVEFPVQYVIGSTFLALAGCLLILTDRIEAILEMPPSTKIEPWILLDASRTGSRLLANGWVLALVVAPWLLIATAVRIASLQVRAEGSVSTVAHDAMLSAFLLLGVMAAAYLSRPLLGGLITLRRARHYQRLSAVAAARPLVNEES